MEVLRSYLNTASNHPIAYSLILDCIPVVARLRAYRSTIWFLPRSSAKTQSRIVNWLTLVPENLLLNASCADLGDNLPLSPSGSAAGTARRHAASGNAAKGREPAS